MAKQRTGTTRVLVAVLASQLVTSWVVFDCAVVAPPLRTIAAIARVHLSTFLNSDTLDSQAINAIFHAQMTAVSGGNVCGLASICLVELFVCLATSLLGKQAKWFHS